MKAINIGDRYELYSNGLKVYDKLPAKNYIVKFDEMSGFYLQEYSDIDIKEEKIYGIHEKKVNKVLKSFKSFDRNLGVILSGNKGIGKSLFAKLLSYSAVKEGYPLVVVDRFYPGIASYLESIEQEVVVLFDEFDKTFGEVKVDSNEATPQSSLLSLFDGIAQGKKLFVITCNDLYKLNDYLVNRPGRFHYHFRFDYPSVDEIREYLSDKLQKEYYSEIDKVISFSRKVNLNYDCLRAIAFELNNGETFESAILDLNIVNLRAEMYNIVLYFTNGKTLSGNYSLDMFNPNEVESVELSTSQGYEICDVNFNVLNSTYDCSHGAIVVDKNNIKITYNGYYENIEQPYKALEIDRLEIRKKIEKSLHYLV